MDDEEVLRQTLRVALADGTFTDDEKDAVRTLRERLGISMERASAIFNEVCTEKGVSPTDHFNPRPPSTPAAAAGQTPRTNPAAVPEENTASEANTTLANLVSTGAQGTPHQPPLTEFRGYEPSFHDPAIPDRLAVVSLIAAMVSLPLFFAFVPALAAITVGVIASRRVRAAHGNIGGMRVAITGIVLGAISLLIGIAWIVARSAH